MRYLSRETLGVLRSGELAHQTQLFRGAIVKFKRHSLILPLTAACALAAIMFVPGQRVLSADHLDPPGRADPAFTVTPDIPADIADIYAFHDADNFYLIYTFGGPAATTRPAAYDRDVLYTINISSAAPAATVETAINFRFGPGANPGEWGISVEGVPGVQGAIVGPVERTISKDGVRVFAGLRDDPFFFDSQGLKESRNTGTIQFNRNRNFFGGKNITTVAIEIPRSRFGNGGNAKLDVWAVSARFGGLL